MKRVSSTSERNTYRWQALLISVLLPCSICPAQVTYYVNGACGDNAWTGLSPICAGPDAPKATIQAAIDAAADGDTVLVAPGTYVGDYVLNRVLTLQSTDGPAATTLTPGAWRPILICNVAMNRRGRKLRRPRLWPGCRKTRSPSRPGCRFTPGSRLRTWHTPSHRRLRIGSR